MNHEKQLRILSPCQRGRDSLEGSGARRWCAECGKTVHDFALMKRAEIESVCASADICGIASYYSDGSLQTADPVPLRALLRRSFLEWGAAAAVSARLLFAEPLKLPPLPEGHGGVHGVVLDQTGSPILRAHALAAGLRVQLVEAGRFLLAPLRPGEVTVKIEGAGFKSAHRDIEVRAGAYVDLGKVVLEVGSMGGGIEMVTDRPMAGPRVKVQGELVSDGAAVPGLWITLVRLVPGHLDQRTRSNEKGRFKFPRVEPGGYELIVEGLGWTTLRLPIAVGSAGVKLGRIAMRHA